MEARALSRLYASTMRHVLATMMSVLLAVMLLQVIARYGFNSSLIWAEELCRYLLIWLSFIACGVAYARGEIAAVELLERSLPALLARILLIFRNVLILGLLGLLVYYGLRYAELSGSQPIPALGFILHDLFGISSRAPITVFWVYAALPIGMAILAVHVAAQTVRCLRELLAARTAGDSP